LMDGPQVKERWPARYASVFADDPGTAVLTLTSIGMINRSSPIDESRVLNQTSVGLWKDQLRGWKNIEVKNSASTALLTISASFREEICADGRSDGGAAAVFKLDNVLYPGDVEPSNDNGQNSEEKKSLKEKSIWRGEWLDLRELTSATFAIDALISSYGEHWDFIRKLIVPIDDAKQIVKDEAEEYYDYMIDLLIGSYKDPSVAGILTTQEEWPTNSLCWGMDEIAKWKTTFDTARAATGDSHDDDLTIDEYLSYFTELVDFAEKDLKEKEREESMLKTMPVDKQDELRIRKAIPLAILISLHNRLDGFRVRYLETSYRRTSTLFKRIEMLITAHGRFKK
jgi:hypothetical protein